MKSYLLIVWVVLIGLTSCNKKDEKPAPASTDNELSLTSELQLKCELDGVPINPINGKDNIKNEVFKTLTYDDIFDDTANIAYWSSFRNKITKEEFIITRGFIESFQGKQPDETTFLSLFAKGKYLFEEGKSEFIYKDENGMEWKTILGNQSDSNFEIIDFNSTGTPTTRSCIALISFNCKLYNSTNPSKVIEIKNAKILAEFGH